MKKKLLFSFLSLMTLSAASCAFYNPVFSSSSDTPSSSEESSANVPYIGTNGNWWIGNTDTGVAAQGPKGDTGAQGEKGDTGAQGEKGDTGAQGEEGKNIEQITVDDLNLLLSAVNTIDNPTPYERFNAAGISNTQLSEISTVGNTAYGRYLYSYDDNAFIVVDDAGLVGYSTVSNYSQGDNISTGDVNLFDFVDASEVSTLYSNYLISNTTALDSISVSNSVDVGTLSDIDVTYTNSTTNALTTLFRTEGGTLTVNDVNDGSVQNHYGFADKAVVNTGTSCFHTHASIANMDLEAGKAIAEEGAFVTLLKAADTGTSVEENGGVFYIPGLIPESVVISYYSFNQTYISLPSSIYSELGYSKQELAGVVASNTYKYVPNSDRVDKLKAQNIEINSVADLLEFRKEVNRGCSFDYVNVNLNADLDLSSISNWEPIGLYKTIDGGNGIDLVTGEFITKPFAGIFNGNDHAITGLNIDAQSTSSNEDYKYVSSYRALFGFLLGTIQDLSVSGSVKGTDVAGVVAAMNTGAIISSVTSNVEVTGVAGYSAVGKTGSKQGKAAGIVIAERDALGGTSPALFAAADHYALIKNCVNNGTISSSGSTEAAAGIISLSSSTTSLAEGTRGVFVIDCSNNGAISSSGDAAGIVGDSAIISIKDCYNNA
nr:collagen-like protein [Bacilli bacterium]